MQLLNAVVIIDGNNLYKGLEDAGLFRYTRLHIPGFAKAVIDKSHRLVHCYYFTSRIRDSHDNSNNAQNDYMDELEKIDNDKLSIVYGRYKKHKLRCPKCGRKYCVRWLCRTRMHDFREKKTDVNMANQMWCHAVKGDCDVIIVVTGDSDLCAPIKSIPEHFPNVRIVVAFPPARFSNELRETAPVFMHIDELMLRNNQLVPKSPRSQSAKNSTSYQCSWWGSFVSASRLLRRR